MEFKVLKRFETIQILSQFADGGYWYLQSDLVWISKNNFEILVPKGFVTDFASVPQPGQALIAKAGKSAQPAIIHDYLYWVQDRTRLEADDIMWEAMDDLKMARWKMHIIYRTVRPDLTGGAAWRSNAALKADGEKRVMTKLPSDPHLTWEEWKPNAFA